MNRIIHVATEVENKIFTNQTHQVVTNHPDIVFRAVGANIGVDGGKTLRYSTTSVHGGFVAKQDFGIVGCPFFDFKRRAAGCHTAANNQNINFAFYNFWISIGLGFTQNFVR